MALVRNPYRKSANTAASLRQKESVTGENGSYNPRPIGGYRGDGRVVASKSGRMFDSNGQLNAYDKKDAMHQVNYLMNDVTVKNPAPKEALIDSLLRQPSRYAAANKESNLSKEAKKRAIVAAFKDPTGEGFNRIGSELIAPIMEIVNYEGWARKCLRQRPLAQAEIFRMTKDVVSQVTSWVVGQDGQTPESRISSKFADAQTYEITTFVDISISDIYKMQFDGLDRAQDLARQDIERKEDQGFVNALSAASTTYNDLTYFTSLNLATFEDVRLQVEQHRLLVDKFLINRRELSDVVKTMSKNDVDIITQREFILSGYIGNILNSKVITSAGTGTLEVVPAGTVYAIPAPEFLGDFGVRIELFAEPFNRYSVQEMVKGWAMLEEIGMIIPNAKAVAKATK